MATASSTADLEAIREQHAASVAALEAVRLTAEIRANDHQRELLDSASRVVEGWGDIVDRREHLHDVPGFGAPAGSQATMPEDRARGRLRPIYETEYELDAIRGVGRWIGNADGTGCGVIDKLTNYTLGNGFWPTIQSRRANNPAPQGLIDDVQAALDEWIEMVGWTGKVDREYVRRIEEDGESLVDLEPQEDAPPRAVFVEPEWLREPSDVRRVEAAYGVPPSDWLFGVATRPTIRNVERPQRSDTTDVRAYFVEWDGDPQQGMALTPDRLHHSKINVPLKAKRGISSFYPVAGTAGKTDRLLDSVLHGAAIQASIALIRNHAPGTTRGGADSMTRVNQRPDGYGGYQRTIKASPGTIIDSSAGMEVHSGPMGTTQGPLFIEVVQAGLRAFGTRWSFPEFLISGDASNANYASTMVSESPFVKAIQAKQNFFATEFSSIWWRVIRWAADAGRFKRHGLGYCAIWKLLTIDVEKPNVEARNANDLAELHALLNDKGVMSKRTWATRSDLDYDHERELIGGEQENQSPVTVDSDAERIAKTPTAQGVEEAERLLREAYP